MTEPIDAIRDYLREFEKAYFDELVSYVFIACSSCSTYQHAMRSTALVIAHEDIHYCNESCMFTLTP